jgi:hypothetical protein
MAGQLRSWFQIEKEGTLIYVESMYICKPQDIMIYIKLHGIDETGYFRAGGEKIVAALPSNLRTCSSSDRLMYTVSQAVTTVSVHMMREEEISPPPPPFNKGTSDECILIQSPSGATWALSETTDGLGQFCSDGVHNGGERETLFEWAVVLMVVHITRRGHRNRRRRVEMERNRERGWCGSAMKTKRRSEIEKMDGEYCASNVIYFAKGFILDGQTD